MRLANSFPHGDMSHWIKDRIAALRAAGKHKTQRELARLLKVDPPRIVEISKGKIGRAHV